MAQPIFNPVNLSALGAAILLGGLSYATSKNARHAAAGAVTGVGLVFGYTTVIQSGRIYMFSTLRPGDHGLAVSKVQERLVLHGYPPLASETPGVFDTQTEEAVKKFQNARGLATTGIVTPETWHELVARPPRAIAEYTVGEILKTMSRLKYTVFQDGRWNIVGLRSRAGSTNSFDDEMHLFRKTAEGWEDHAYPMTADPGTYYLKTPLNGSATAAVVPGQYPDSHAFGLHKGQYEALVQVGPLWVYRDGNRDAKFDYDPKSIVRGTYGINIHKASTDSKSVDNWSAGCQVFARSRDFAEFISLLKQAPQPKFTYTLLAENQIRGLLT
jgi:peptidoglycan hydrolase-like protein with peptidoglycan-binding domain